MGEILYRCRQINIQTEKKKISEQIPALSIFKGERKMKTKTQ